MKFLKYCSLGLCLGLFTTNVIAKDVSRETTQPISQQQTTLEQPKIVQNINAVNINTATTAELKDKLIGVGTKKAQAIVEYREKNGKFLTIEQITEVSGIGKKTLEKNRDRILIN